MRSLIVNADDLGSGVERDRGIVEAFREGIVSSASLLVNGPSFHSAVDRIKEFALPIGIHLNLSEGESLTGVIPGLTDESGRFPGKDALRRLLAEERVAPAHLQAELTAQIEKALRAGLQPDHLDSHQHFSLFPAATSLLLDLARVFDLPALRLPLPAEAAAADPGGELGREMALYRRLAPDFVRGVQQSGILTPDGLFGMPLLNRFDLSRLLEMISAVPDGCWELMVHPGYPDGVHPFGGLQRLEELRALTSPEAKAVLQRNGITLVSFREMACGF